MARRWLATRPADLDSLRLVDFDPAPPAPGEVQLEVRAAGVNPADHKHLARGGPDAFPRGVGYEVSGVVQAVGEGTDHHEGTGLGAEVLAFRVTGGWASVINVPAGDVFAKPAAVSFEAAANLLLAGTTAAEMLHVVGADTDAARGGALLVHGASGAVGVMALQLARRHGLRVLGTASRAGAERVRRFGAEPLAYGPGLLDRVRAAAPDGVFAALDCVGTDEAVDVSLAVTSPDRIVTAAAPARAAAAGFDAVSGTREASIAFRNAVRAELVALAGNGELEVPLARSFPHEEARAAIDLVRTGHPGGKVTLLW